MKMENLLVINEIGDMMLLEIINEKLKQMECWNKSPPLFCQLNMKCLRWNNMVQ